MWLTGLGWRHPHYVELLASKPSLPFLEVHSENFFARGAAPVAMLSQARLDYEISLHGVGLGLGSAVGLDAWHLDQLADLVTRIDPVRVSDHASFARAPSLGAEGGVVHGADLLPVPFTEDALVVMCRHVQQVQERLQRPILIENLSAYVEWAQADYEEVDFLMQVARRTGCQLLLDVNNLVVNALNTGRADAVTTACKWVDAVELGSVGEIHLAGYNDSGPLVIDDHGSGVHAPVWEVYAHAIQRLGAVPTLLEWDTQVPDLAVLLQEVAKADQVASLALTGRLTGPIVPGWAP